MKRTMAELGSALYSKPPAKGPHIMKTSPPRTEPEVMPKSRTLGEMAPAFYAPPKPKVIK